MALCPNCAHAAEGDWCPSCGAAMNDGFTSERDWRRVEQDWRRLERSEGPSKVYSSADFVASWRRMLLGAKIALGCAGGLIAVSVAGSVSAFTFGSSTLLGTATLVWILSLGALGGAIAASVYWHVLLYKMWDQAQAITDRSTPGRAVGFLFIPFFNFYWQFVAYLHLARAMNTRLAQIGAPRKLRIGDGLVIAACILTILSFVLFAFAWATSLAFGICACILAVQYKNAAVAIADRGQMGI